MTFFKISLNHVLYSKREAFMSKIFVPKSHVTETKMIMRG